MVMHSSSKWQSSKTFWSTPKVFIFIFIDLKIVHNSLIQSAFFRSKFLGRAQALASSHDPLGDWISHTWIDRWFPWTAWVQTYIWEPRVWHAVMTLPNTTYSILPNIWLIWLTAIIDHDSCCQQTDTIIHKWRLTFQFIASLTLPGLMF